jgi:predicted transcriptional regulator of viral defense system
MRTESHSHLDLAIADLATRQHGVVSRAQLVAIGVSAQAIGRGMRSGRLHRLHAGVYAVGHRRLTQHGRWAAAVLAGGDGAVLSHRSAAALWQIRPATTRPEVTLPRMRRGTAGILYHRSVIPADEVAVNEGIPVTTVARTLLDLAAVTDRRQVRKAINEAEYRQLWDEVSLVALVARYPYRRGVATARALVRERGRGITRSELEERFLTPRSSFSQAAGSRPTASGSESG